MIRFTSTLASVASRGALAIVLLVLPATARSSDVLVEQRVSERNESRDGSTARVAGVVLKWLRCEKEANYARAEKLIS